MTLTHVNKAQSQQARYERRITENYGDEWKRDGSVSCYLVNYINIMDKRCKCLTCVRSSWVFIFSELFVPFFWV